MKKEQGRIEKIKQEERKMANKFFNSKTFYILASVFFAIVLFFNANATSIRNQGTNQSGEVYTATINNLSLIHISEPTRPY